MIYSDVGELTTPTSTGTEQYNHNCTDPQVVLLFGIRGSAGNARIDDASITIGAGDGSNSYSGLSFTDTGITPPGSSNDVCGIYTSIRFFEGLTPVLQATVSAITSSNFSLNYTTLGVSMRSKKLFWVVLGGDVKMLQIDAATSPGDQDYTGAGFEPDGQLLFGGQWTLGANLSSTYFHMLGVATSTSQRAAACAKLSIASSSITNLGAYRENAVLTRTGTWDVVADFKTWDADGFTWNYSWVDATAYDLVTIVFNTGGNAKVGIATQPTSTGSQTLEASLGFDRVLALFFSAGKTVAGHTTGPEEMQMFGAALNPTDQGVIWAGGNEDNPSEMDASHNNARCIELREGGNGAAVNSGGYLETSPATQLKVYWDAADATQRKVPYLIIGNAAAPSGIVPFRRRIEGY